MDYEFETIKFELNDNGIGILTLNRPKKLNCHNFQMCEELHQLLDHLKANLDCRVLIIKGEGKAFCAGTDLNDVALLNKKKKPEEYKKFNFMQPNEVIKGKFYFLSRIAEVTVKMRRINQPIIALIHGAASGGGFSLTMASDIRIATNNAKFNMAAVKVGLSGGDMGSSYFLPRLIGMSRAAELLYTGRFMEAEEALQCGYVSKIIKEEELLNIGIGLAKDMLKKSPIGLRMTKELLNRTLDAPSLDTITQLESNCQIISGSSRDAVESVQAFFEKRDPIHPLK